MNTAHDLLIARPRRQAPKSQERLAAFAEDYGQRLKKLERSGEQLREERDEAIREAYREDLPMKAIAQVMGMSHQRVSQIVRS